jgi:hypothetical protein
VGAETGSHSAAAPGARELLDPDRVVDVVAALTAVFGLVLEAEKAELATAVVELAWKLAGLLPVIDVRGDLLGDEAADRLAKLLVLLGEWRKQGTLTGVLDDGQLATSSELPSAAFRFASSGGGFQSSSIVCPRAA